MQEFWGTFEFLALAVLFGLQIYFLIIALKKMKMMGDFFPDIKSIHIKRIALDEKGKEIKDQSETNSSLSTTSGSADGSMSDEENKSRRSSTPSVKEMRNMKVEELRPYVKYISRAYWSRTASEYCMNTEHIVAPKDSIVAIKSSYNDFSSFGPSKTYTVEEFETIMTLPNVYANRLYEVVRTKTGSTPTEIKVLTPGRCVEDGTRWKIVNKCRISI